MHLEEGEKLRKKDTTVRYDRGGLTARAGILTLTNRRLVFEQVHLVAGSLGAIGMALTNMLPHQVVVNLPLSEISGFSRGNYGLHDNVLVVRANDGSEYRFLTHYDQWASVLGKSGIRQKQPTA